MAHEGAIERPQLIFPNTTARPQPRHRQRRMRASKTRKYALLMLGFLGYCGKLMFRAVRALAKRVFRFVVRHNLHWRALWSADWTARLTIGTAAIIGIGWIAVQSWVLKQPAFQDGIGERILWSFMTKQPLVVHVLTLELIGLAIFAFAGAMADAFAYWPGYRPNDRLTGIATKSDLVVPKWWHWN